METNKTGTANLLAMWHSTQSYLCERLMTPSSTRHPAADGLVYSAALPRAENVCLHGLVN